MSDLESQRREIDRLDEQIIGLLNARARCVVEIGRLKAASGASVFAADREQQILDRIRQLNSGPLSNDSLLAVYRELMSASFALERPLRVAYLGPAGSFSHEAAFGKFGTSVEYEPLAHIAGIFEAVTRGHADLGVVPVENTLGGAVLDSLEGLVDSGLKICCEIQRQIHQNLMSRGPLAGINVVYSKPEAFAQCQRFLGETGLAAKTAGVASTSRAAELARDEPGAAAIGSALAAQLQGLTILAENIEDSPNNVTRFLVIGRQTTKPTGDDKTSISFVTADRAGALVEVLLTFREHGVNLSMITSRHGRKRDLEYVFFLDLLGHAEDDAVRAALDEARPLCRSLAVLGSYPCSREVVGG